MAWGLGTTGLSCDWLFLAASFLSCPPQREKNELQNWHHSSWCQSSFWDQSCQIHTWIPLKSSWSCMLGRVGLQGESSHPISSFYNQHFETPKMAAKLSASHDLLEIGYSLIQRWSQSPHHSNLCEFCLICDK